MCVCVLRNCQIYWDCKISGLTYDLELFEVRYRSVAPTTSVGMRYGTKSKERSFGNVCRTILRCRSYAPLTWFHISFLQTLSELRSYIDPDNLQFQ